MYSRSLFFREYIYKEGRKMAGLIEKLHKIGDVINTVARVALGGYVNCFMYRGNRSVYFAMVWSYDAMGSGVLLLYLRLDHDAWQCRSKPSSASISVLTW